MLVVSLKEQEKLLVGDEVQIMVVEIRGKLVNCKDKDPEKIHDEI